MGVQPRPPPPRFKNLCRINQDTQLQLPRRDERAQKKENSQWQQELLLIVFGDLAGITKPTEPSRGVADFVGMIFPFQTKFNVTTNAFHRNYDGFEHPFNASATTLPLCPRCFPPRMPSPGIHLPRYGKCNPLHRRARRLLLRIKRASGPIS